MHRPRGVVVDSAWPTAPVFVVCTFGVRSRLLRNAGDYKSSFLWGDVLHGETVNDARFMVAATRGNAQAFIKSHLRAASATFQTHQHVNLDSARTGSNDMHSFSTNKHFKITSCILKSWFHCTALFESRSKPLSIFTKRDRILIYFPKIRNRKETFAPLKCTIFLFRENRRAQENEAALIML